VGSLAERLDRAWQQGRWLRLSQILWFLRLKLYPRTKPAEIEAEETRDHIHVKPWLRQPQSDKAEFNFLGYSRPVEEDPVNWLPREVERVWRYNLHYFEYLLWDSFSDELNARLINDWIRNNPMGSEDAWEPCTVSIRIISWIKYFETLQGDVPEAWQKSLVNQANYLTRNLELEILGNHYFKNGKALVFAGAWFAGSVGERFLRKGLAILQPELHEQILADGGHFERTLMYHSIILEDLLDLANLAEAQPGLFSANYRKLIAEKSRAATRFLEDMRGADGQIVLFNDCAWHIAPEPEELISYAERVIGYERAPRPPGPVAIDKRDSGYFGYRSGGDSLVIDCGIVAPDYQPGHAHADMLSYELCVDGQRLIVDTGTYTYAEDERREYLRSTAAHNTVEVDGIDQTQFWDRFRVGHRARPLKPRIEEFSNTGMRFRGAHNGYRRLPQKVIHERLFEVEFAGRWAVTDMLRGKGECEARSFIHFAPGVEVSEDEAGSWFVRSPAGSRLVLSIPAGCDATVDTTEFYPKFGVIEKKQTLTLVCRAKLPFELSYCLERAPAPILT
jgi:uncharacterized heparinase superfamily protein